MIQAILALAVILILFSTSQTGLAIFVIMGIASVLIFRNGVSNYEASKKK